jgi:hypothetical protein
MQFYFDFTKNDFDTQFEILSSKIENRNTESKYHDLGIKNLI